MHINVKNLKTIKRKWTRRHMQKLKGLLTGEIYLTCSQSQGLEFDMNITFCTILELLLHLGATLTPFQEDQ